MFNRIEKFESYPVTEYNYFDAIIFLRLSESLCLLRSTLTEGTNVGGTVVKMLREVS